MTHDEKIAIIKASKEGKPIEFARKGKETWCEMGMLNEFDFNAFKYRTAEGDEFKHLAAKNGLNDGTSNEFTFIRGAIAMKENIIEALKNPPKSLTEADFLYLLKRINSLEARLSQEKVDEFEKILHRCRVDHIELIRIIKNEKRHRSTINEGKP